MKYFNIFIILNYTRLYQFGPEAALIFGASSFIDPITSLFGGSKDSQGNDPNFFQIGSDIARSREADKNRIQISQGLHQGQLSPNQTNQSLNILPGQTLSQQNQQRLAYQKALHTQQQGQQPPWYKSLGQSLANQFTTQLGSAITTQGVNKLFAPKEVPITQPNITGAQQKAYMDAAYPGTNAWERLGGSTGSAAGGTIAARTGARAKEEAAMIGGRSQITSANIASLPHLKSVELEYQKTPSIIKATHARAGLDTSKKYLTEQQETGQQYENINKQALDVARTKLMRAQKELTGAHTQQSAEQQKQIIQQTLNALKNMPAIMEDAKIKRNLRRVSDIMAGEDWRVYTSIGIGAIGGLLRSLPFIRGAFGGKGKKFGKKQFESMGQSSKNLWNRFNR